MTIELSTNDLSDIEQFIDEMWSAGKSSKCGNSKEAFSDAYSKGKGAEVALQRFLDEKGVETEVDFDVYEDSDDGDLRSMKADDGTKFRPSIEVKQCPHYGKWVAIPHTQFRHIEEGTPIVQVKTHSEDEYEVAGWCFPEDLHTIEQGEKPFTQYGANECIRISQLSQDWDALVEAMSGGRTSIQQEPKFTFSR